MNPMIGEYSIAGALLLSLVAVVAAVAHWRLGTAGALQAVRAAVCGVFVCLTAASAILLTALLQDNFLIDYVARHSERVLPLGYKIAAFWAGQEGSLLFWAWLIGIFGLLLVLQTRRGNGRETAIVLATMAVVTGFFSLVMLFAANPFGLVAERVTDGRGLNPLLQNLAMVFHPPLLFVGYAAYTAPLAIWVGAIWTRREDHGWLDALRPWVLLSWLFLTVGIVLGAQWAYVELGWGGYWAWDPVENASLLPWLTGTALLHALAVYRKRGLFKVWTGVLVVASFWLCIFGTYLTRSGVIQSVHSFGDSPLGKFFLVFMIITALASVVLWLMRLEMFKPDRPLNALFNREGMILLGNVLLVAMTLIVMLATIWPVIARLWGGQDVTVAPPFYNKVILPLGLLLALVMATGPVLGYGEGAAERSRPWLIAMALVAVLAVIAIAITGYFSMWTVGVAATVAAVITASAIDFIINVLHARHHASLPAALLQTVVGQRRRWAAQLAHLGLATVIVGVAGSSLYATDENIVLTKGKSQQVGAYNITFNKLSQKERPNHIALIADVGVTPVNGGETMLLQPERRKYFKGMDPSQTANEVALRLGLSGDVYVSLAGWENEGDTATLHVILNPLINFIWIGSTLMTLAGLVALIPIGRGAHTGSYTTDEITGNVKQPVAA